MWGVLGPRWGQLSFHSLTLDNLMQLYQELHLVPERLSTMRLQVNMELLSYPIRLNILLWEISILPQIPSHFAEQREERDSETYLGDRSELLTRGQEYSSCFYLLFSLLEMVGLVLILM